MKKSRRVCGCVVMMIWDQERHTESMQGERRGGGERDDRVDKMRRSMISSAESSEKRSVYTLVWVCMHELRGGCKCEIEMVREDGERRERRSTKEKDDKDLEPTLFAPPLSFSHKRSVALSQERSEVRPNAQRESVERASMCERREREKERNEKERD